MGTLASRLARLEQHTGSDSSAVMGVVHDYDADTDRPGVVKVQPGDGRCSVAEFHQRYPRGLLVVRRTFGGPHADDLKPA